MTVLAVVAHPDDESFAMGGTLAQHAQAGDTVHVVTLADGVGSRYHREWRKVRLQDEWQSKCSREVHFAAACRAIGAATHRMLWAFPDQQADTESQLAINRRVERVIEHYHPTRVYTHTDCDLNLDHRRVSEAVQVATRGVCPVWMAEPEWPERGVGRRFTPTTWVELTAAVFDMKLQACACYVEELRAPPHPRSLACIAANATRRGGLSEPFEVIS